MNKAQTTLIITYLQGLYPTLKGTSEDEYAEMVTAWADVLQEFEPAIVKQACVEFAKSHDTHYVPSASEIYNVAKDIPKPVRSDLLPAPYYGDDCPYRACNGDGVIEILEDGYEETLICPCDYDKRVRKAYKNGGNVEQLMQLKTGSIRNLERLKANATKVINKNRVQWEIRETAV